MKKEYIYIILTLHIGDMRKARVRILLFIIIMWGIYFWKLHELKKHDEPNPSVIENIINVTSGANSEQTGQSMIDLTSDADGWVQYQWGWVYTNYSDEALQSALEKNQRVILVFEQQWDPTGEALHDDIVRRETRIPKNTTILFVPINMSEIAQRYRVQYHNTIVYLDSNNKEIRRSGNGIITLAQIVSGIAGLK